MSAVATAHVQGTPAWVDARRDVVGSSDIPIITGSSPYHTSLFTLWALKTRLAPPEPVDDDTQELFDLGHALEPVIAARYTAVTGREVRRRRYLLTHPAERWMGASLDRVSARRGERRIIEIKWSPNRRWALDGPEPVPHHVQDQVQWQLAVTGWDVADVAVLAGSHVEVYEVGPSDAYQADLRYLARHSWDLGARRAADGRRVGEHALDDHAPPPPRHARDAEPSAETAAIAYGIRDASGALKAAKEEDGRLRNEMRLLLAEHSGVEDADYRIHYRRSADSTVVTTDWQAVVTDLRRLVSGVVSEAVDRVEVLRTLDAIEEDHTTTEVREGRRALLPKFRDADSSKWV